MKRFNLDPCMLTVGEDICNASMIPCDDGEYIEYKDTKAAVDLIVEIRSLMDMSMTMPDKKIMENLRRVLHSSNIGCIGT
jgi:hypothetical protein